MEYWKIKKSIREILEQNKEKISDRAEARLIKMSQKGYTSMMENHSMSVKKLEEVASILNKSVSYFFVISEEKDHQGYSEAAKTIKVDVVEESYGCKLCAEKERLIEMQNKHIAFLEFSLGKNQKNGSE